MEIFYTVGEVSQMLKVSEVWIYKLVREGKIPFVRVAGKTVRIKGSEIEDWIEQGRGKRYYRDKFREAQSQNPDRPSEN